MKMITLNTHSLEEEQYEKKLEAFVEGVCQMKPQVIALQEVNQTRTAAPAPVRDLERSGYIPCDPAICDPAICDPASCNPDACNPVACSPAVIREDNHAYRAAKMLAARGLFYWWTWVSAKIGYGKYDEGLAILCQYPVLDARQFFITQTCDYENWKTRKILGLRARTDSGPQQFYSVHMGWWKDDEEPFERQWQRIVSRIADRSDSRTGVREDVLGREPVWLMGDFNSPAGIPGEGHELILSSGFLDSYELAEEKDGGITVDHSIDGWKNGDAGQNRNQNQNLKSGMRIDYIWTDTKVPVRRSRVVFDGSCHPVVSDHFGVFIECADRSKYRR